MTAPRPPQLMLVSAGGRARLPLARLAAAAARGGADLVQVREPDLTDRALVELAAGVVRAVAGTPCRVVVNDRLDVALAAGAHGVHLKARSLAPAEVRLAAVREAGEDLLVGVSCHDADELADAAAGEADWVTVGPLGDVPGKRRLGVEGIAAVLAAARARGPALPPWLVLGGVRAEDVAALARLRATDESWGIALMRAWADARDEVEAEAAARALRAALDATRRLDLPEGAGYHPA